MNDNARDTQPLRREHRPHRAAPRRLYGGTADRVGQFVLAATTVAGITVCVFLAAPFLSALTWALTLAIVFAPMHARIEGALKRPSGSAVISVLIIALLVTIPIVFIAERLVEEAAISAAVVQSRIESGAFQQLLASHPSLAPISASIQRQIDLPAILASTATWLSNVGAALARSSIFRLVEVVVAFYLLFFFLRDRHAAGRMLQDWLPLTNAESEQLFRRVIDTVHATIYGTLAMAVVQGLLGGLMFWALGLPTPLFWGLVMGLLTVVPVVGSFIVWLPAAIILALDGLWSKAVILTLFGLIVVVGGIHNLLYPMFVGNRLRLHTVPAFISMIGGLVLFGASGFILGPLVVTVTTLLLVIWRHRNHPQSQALE